MRTKIILALLIVSFVAVGCMKSAPANNQPAAPQIEGVKPTGVTLELSDKNGQTVTTTPGDIVHFALTNEMSPDKQWLIKSPTKGNEVLLMNHTVNTATTTGNKKPMETSDWSLKVETKSPFTIQYDYVSLKNGKSEKTFKVNIVSQ